MSNTNESMIPDAHAFDRAVADLKQGVQTATAAQTDASEKAIKTAKDFASFSQGTFEAYAQASQILAAGTQDMVRQMAASSQTAFSEALASMRAIVTAHTAKDRIELQSNFVRTSAVWAVSETSRFAHAGIELAEKAAAPLTARTILAAESITTKS